MNTDKIIKYIKIILILCFALFLTSTNLTLAKASIVNGCWNGNPNYPFWPRMEENDAGLMKNISFADLVGTKRKGNAIYVKVLYVGPHRELKGRQMAKDDIVTYETEVFEELRPDRVAHYANQQMYERRISDAVFDPQATYGRILSIVQKDYFMVRKFSR